MGSPSAAQRKTAVVTRNRLPLRGTADAQPMMPPPLQPPTTAPSRPWPPSAALPPPLEPPPAVAAPPLSYLAAGARAGARSTHGIDHRSNIMCNNKRLSWPGAAADTAGTTDITWSGRRARSWTQLASLRIDWYVETESICRVDEYRRCVGMQVLFCQKSKYTILDLSGSGPSVRRRGKVNTQRRYVGAPTISDMT